VRTSDDGGMPYDPIQGQGQGHGGPNFAKMADFKVYLLRRYVCSQVKGIAVNYDTPCNIFNRIDF